MSSKQIPLSIIFQRVVELTHSCRFRPTETSRMNMELNLPAAHERRMGKDHERENPAIGRSNITIANDRRSEALRRSRLEYQAAAMSPSIAR